MAHGGWANWNFHVSFVQVRYLMHLQSKSDVHIYFRWFVDTRMCTTFNVNYGNQDYVGAVMDLQPPFQNSRRLMLFSNANVTDLSGEMLKQKTEQRGFDTHKSPSSAWCQSGKDDTRIALPQCRCNLQHNDQNCIVQ